MTELSGTKSGEHGGERNSRKGISIDDGPRASVEIIRHMELGGILCILTKIIEASSSLEVLGLPTEYPDPICEALSRMINHQSRLIIQREIVPGNPRSIEHLSVDKCKYDTNFLRELLAMRRDHSVMGNIGNLDSVMEELSSWSGKRMEPNACLYADVPADDALANEGQ